MALPSPSVTDVVEGVMVSVSLIWMSSPLLDPTNAVLVPKTNKGIDAFAAGTCQ